MESSRILVAPGLRTLARPGWRAGLTTALSVVCRQPQLWLLGMVGFLLRGGVLLLAVPIVVLPTQVEARLLIGGYLGSTGFAASFWGLVAATALLAAALAVVVLLVLARTELAAFERLMDDPEADHAAIEPARLSRSNRRRLFFRLFGLQVVTFVTLMACVAPLASAVGQKTFEEIVRPSSSSSIYARVLSGIGEPVFLFLVALVVVEMLSALATRELLVRASGWRGSPGSRRLWLLPAVGSALARLALSPLRTLGTAAVGWIATAVVLVPAVWAVTIAWQAVRGAFLTSVGFSDGPELLGLIFVALGLSAAFVLAIALAGFASALRAALWSVDRLR